MVPVNSLLLKTSHELLSSCLPLHHPISCGTHSLHLHSPPRSFSNSSRKLSSHVMACSIVSPKAPLRFLLSSTEAEMALDYSVAWTYRGRRPTCVLSYPSGQSRSYITSLHSSVEASRQHQHSFLVITAFFSSLVLFALSPACSLDFFLLR